MYMGKEGREKGRVENWKEGRKEEKGTEPPAWNGRNFSLFQSGNLGRRVAWLKQELFTFVYNLHAGFTTNPVSMDKMPPPLTVNSLYKTDTERGPLGAQWVGLPAFSAGAWV